MATSESGGTKPPQASGHRASPADGWRPYGRRMLHNVVVVLAVAVVVVLLGYLLAAFVPRWWAQWIGRRVDGSLTAGTVWGRGPGEGRGTARTG